MRIFFVTPEFIDVDTLELFDGGIANEYYKFALLLKKLGHDINIAIPSCKNKKVVKDGIKVYFVKENFAKKISKVIHMFSKRKRKFVREHSAQFSIKYFLYIYNLFHKIDIVQYTNYRYLCQYVNKNIPSCIRIASYAKIYQKAYNYFDKNELVGEIESFSKHPFIYGPCDYIADYIKNDLGLEIDIPIIETPFLPSTNERDYSTLNDIKKITNNKPYLLFFGSLGLLKGCFDIGECIYELLDTHKDLYFAFAGKKVPNDGIDPVNFIKEKAREYSDRILYLDRLPHKKLYPVIENSLACVMPSRAENFSNTCIEAMSLKKIVLGSTPYFGQIIKDGENGFLCEPENPKNLLEKLNSILNLSKEELKSMEENAYKRSQECSPDKMLEKTLEYYKFVIKNWKKCSRQINKAIYPVSVIDKKQFSSNNSDKKITNLIYTSLKLDIRAGGPSGYLANLRVGLDKINNSKDFLNWIIASIEEWKEPPKNFILKLIYKFPLLKYLYVNYFSKERKNMYKWFCRKIRALDYDILSEDIIKSLSEKNIKSVHCHILEDFFRIYNTCKYLDIKPKFILTSHCPESISYEIYNIFKEFGYSEKKCLYLKNLWQKVEEKAFKKADILIFPSKEAMEPYYETIPNFGEWIKDKDVRFFQTGAKAIKTSKTKEELRKQFNIPDDKNIVVYIGRHNEVKGYDVLTDAGRNILSKRNDTLFLIGGKPNALIPPPKNKNWRELGWVNPAELLKIADVFVLPNKRTYFDLILLEVMSTGTPVIATNTGGNKSVQDVTGSLIMYDGSANDLEKKLSEFLNKTEAEKKELSTKILKAYADNYTPEHFAQRYIDLIEQIYKDYGGIS